LDNLEQQLQPRKRPPFLKAINNNNYGREATTFLKARQNNGIFLDYWEQQLRQQLGTTTTTTTGAKRPPFLREEQQLRPIGNNNYGREAAAFLNEASNGNKNYGREAAAFLNSSNCYKKMGLGT